MKAKYTLIALLAITFFGCDDNTAGLGLGMFPGSDQNINGRLSTFDVTTESVHTGLVYAKTNIGYVGKFTDETFGTYEAGFLAQLNCPDGITMPSVYEVTETGTNGEAIKATGALVTSFDNIEMDENAKQRYTLIKDGNGKVIGNCQISMNLWYSSYFGDSLTASRLSVYEISEELKEEEAYYTNIDPKIYYKPDSLLGTQSYTALDLSVSDSIRNLNGYMPSVNIRLSPTRAEILGKKLFSSAKAYGSDFAKDFPNQFKGVYVENDYGDGTVLYVNLVQMTLVSIEYVTDSITGVKKKAKSGKDSIQYARRSFYSTREVIQANQLKNDKEAIQACIDNPNWTYLKSPAGIFTQVTLPVTQIAEKLQGDTLNAVRLSMPIYNQTNDKKVGMSVPKSVLLIRKKYKDTFFEGNKLSDGITSSLCDYSSYSSFTQYTFNNITQLVNNCLGDGEREEAEKLLKTGPITLKITDSEGKEVDQTVSTIEEWEKYSDWNKFLLIPVLVTKDSSTSSSGSSNIIGTQHDLKPSYARLKGGTKGLELNGQNEPLNPDNILKLEVVSTNFFGTKSE